jgi:hypothetical protein
MFGNPSQHFRPDLDAVVKGPNKICEAGSLQNNVGGTSEGLRRPTDPQQRLVNARRFRTRPSAHAKLIIFCPIFSDSMRSAITRSARASTAASASFFVAPYAMTPGNSGISAIQRPSSSRSNSILKFNRFPLFSIRCYGKPNLRSSVQKNHFDGGCPTLVAPFFERQGGSVRIIGPFCFNHLPPSNPSNPR